MLIAYWTLRQYLHLALTTDKFMELIAYLCMFSVGPPWKKRNRIDEWKTNLMSLAVLFHLLCAKHVSDINISIFRSKIASDIKLVFHSST